MVIRYAKVTQMYKTDHLDEYEVENVKGRHRIVLYVDFNDTHEGPVETFLSRHDLIDMLHEIDKRED